VIAALALSACGEVAQPEQGPADSRDLLFAAIDDSTNDSHIFAASIDEGTVRQVTSGTGTHHSPAWSPDGTRIAFASDSLEPGNVDIYVMLADGSSRERVTTSPAIDTGPEWADDGTILYLHTANDGDRQARLVEADGTHDRLMNGMTGLDVDYAWAPSGDSVAATTNSGGQVSITLVDANDGSRKVVTSDSSGSQTSSTWTSDPGRLAFIQEDSSGATSIVLADTVESTFEIVAPSAGLRTIEWGEGSLLAFQGYDYVSMTPEGTQGEIGIVDAASGEVVNQVTVPENLRVLWGLSW
jgi:Tol biopolymer transport system component